MLAVLVRNLVRITITAVMAATVLLIGHVPANAADPFVVYLDPSGSTANDGLTPATAVPTLARAQQILQATQPATDVEIRVASGLYTAGPLTWSFYVAGRTISFLPVGYQPGTSFTGTRPVFRGNGTAGFWLNARLPSGHAGGNGNLRFYYLQVERYSTGGLYISGGTKIDSAGITVPSTIGLNGNTVYGMVFIRLGSRYAPEAFAYGGVDLVNSSDNTIRNNHFVNNENLSPNAGLIHGVYLAHHSKRNAVAANRFSFISGDPVRTRNDSNDNDIYSNTFERTGVSAFYSEWFCDASCVEQNPGHGRECASHGNVFRENTLVSGYSGGTIPTWKLYPADLNYPGGVGCTNEGQVRLRTWGNVT